MTDWVGKAVREQRRRERLGEEAACAICGWNDYRALERLVRSLVEDHHLVGRQRDDEETVPLCLNHHAVVTEENRDTGIPMQPGPNLLEEQAMKLKARGLFHIRHGNAQVRDAEALWDLIETLDQECPEWRGATEGTESRKEEDDE